MRSVIIVFFLSSFIQIYAQQPWEVTTYPDEEGYQIRIKGVIENIAREEFGEKSKARS